MLNDLVDAHRHYLPGRVPDTEAGAGNGMVSRLCGGSANCLRSIHGERNNGRGLRKPQKAVYWD